MNPLPSVRQAYSSVSQEEKQRLLSATHTGDTHGGSAAMAVRSGSSRPTATGEGRRNERPYGSRPSPDHFHGRPQRGEEGRRRADEMNTLRWAGDFEKRPSGPGMKGRPQCTHCGQMGHWAQTCYVLRGFPPGHPRAKFSGPSPFSAGRPANFYNRPASNNVSTGPSPFYNRPAECRQSKEENNSSIMGISEEQIKQLLSLLDIKNEASSSQAHTAAKPGSGYEEDDWFG